MLTVMSILVTGIMIKQMEMVNISIKMVQNIMASGFLINKMVMELKSGQMVPSILVNTLTAKNMA